MYNTCKKAVFIMIVKSCLYIVQHTHLMEQTDILECSGNSRFVDINGTLSGDILPVQIDNSLIRLIHTCKKIKDCSLTGTVRTDQTIKLSFLDGDMEIIHCMKTAE